MVIDQNHFAILYETITGQNQKRTAIGIVGNDTLDLDAYLAKRPGIAAIVVPRSSHPGPDQNEHFCRQAIADATGVAYFPRGADRAVMVHPAGHVVSVHLGNVPGLDRPEPDHQLISHLSAEIGDKHSGGRMFLREYAVVHSETGKIAHTITALVDEPKDIMPSSPLPGHHVQIASTVKSP